MSEADNIEGKNIRFSIVVPVYNEAEALAPLHAEILEVMQAQSEAYEILYIDDGSTDSSLEVLKGLKGSTVIELSRNYGQATALDAGFKAAAKQQKVLFN